MGEYTVFRISELKLKIGHTQADLDREIRNVLRLKHNVPYEIMRRAIDARKKPELFYVYTVDVAEKTAMLRKHTARNVQLMQRKDYRFPCAALSQPPKYPPVVVGSGPAGLFCALMLARAGLCPIVLERGEPAAERIKTVERYWKTGELNPESNVQFGEGGAGTFSDGKLNTQIRDNDGKIRFVLEEFVRAGASPEIRYDYKPHIGTDVLVTVVSRIRKEIEQLGGRVLFGACLTGIQSRKMRETEEFSEDVGRYRLIVNNGELEFLTNHLVLAIGHSARDTFSMLHRSGFSMQPKAFAVGLRMIHPQNMINQAMYGTEQPGKIGAAPYKLTHRCENGRSVYSFCMCPGGYVVNASSEMGGLAVNGMSYSGRGSKTANSAIVVTVSPEDYGGDSVLAGISFQRKLEAAAYRAGNGKLPVQRYGDFCRREPGKDRKDVLAAFDPEIKGQFVQADVRTVLPEALNEALEEGICAFGKRIPGFDSEEAWLVAVESRTSSPVRILRGETCQAEGFPGIFPCGEGAGYAGGITSAAVDGIRVAEAVAGCFCPQPH